MTESLLADIREAYRLQKQLGDGALAQATEASVHFRLDVEGNTIAVIVKHLYGNARSRWPDFLTADGEKASRRRDEEFEADDASLETVRAWWEDTWTLAFATLTSLTASDLQRNIILHGKPLSVPLALLKQLGHIANHVGQIVMLAKHGAGPKWATLSVPRVATDEYHERLRRVEEEQG